MPILGPPSDKPYKMQKVGKVRADRTHSNGRDWNSYRKTDKQPTGWSRLSTFKSYCNAQTRCLSVVYYPKWKPKYYGWLDASFPSEYKGEDYDVYVCQ